MYLSKTDEWETPQDVFDALNAEFLFNLDAAASDSNHKCSLYYTQESDGLQQSWEGFRVFCNPPYSQIAAWVEKAFRETRHDKTLVCLLIPARTDTKYFHDFILHRSEIRFLDHRLRFGNSTNNAPFPVLVVIFRGGRV